MFAFYQNQKANRANKHLSRLDKTITKFESVSLLHIKAKKNGMGVSFGADGTYILRADF